MKWPLERPLAGVDGRTLDVRTSQLPRTVARHRRADEGTPALSALRQDLINIVKKYGLEHLDEPVQLASGGWSSDFIDGKRALARGDNLRLACEALIELAGEMGVEFDAVGGLTLGADQFAHGVAILKPCDWFVVRKERKGRGTNKRIEGSDLKPGSRVLLVDDVVTRGGSIRDAYNAVRNESGAVIVGAVTLVDRGGHADGFFKDERVPYRPLVTYEDLGIEPVDGGLLNA